jgi:hypothetical protein
LEKTRRVFYLCVVLRNARGGIGRRATLRG